MSNATPADAAARQPADAPKLPARPRSAPKLPDAATATKEEWQDFQHEYAGWVERATDEELLAEMVAIPEDGRPLSPSEAWRYHQCEMRRRRPARAANKKG